MGSPQDAVRRAIRRHRFCTLATSSAANRPHVAGVLYAEADGLLYVHTLDDTVKARNLRENPKAAVCIPVPKLPLVPPFVVQFQGIAEVLPRDDAAVAALVQAKRLKAITSHGELDEPKTVWLRITPSRRIATYGVGVPLLEVARKPLEAFRSVDMAG